MSRGKIALIVFVLVCSIYSAYAQDNVTNFTATSIDGNYLVGDEVNITFDIF